MLGLDAILWLNAVLYHPDLWILKTASMGWWFIARAVVYIMILIGTLLCARCIDRGDKTE